VRVGGSTGVRLGAAPLPLKCELSTRKPRRTSIRRVDRHPSLVRRPRPSRSVWSAVASPTSHRFGFAVRPPTDFHAAGQMLARTIHGLPAATGCKPAWLCWPRVPRQTVGQPTARLGTASAALPGGLSLRLATEVHEMSGLGASTAADVDQWLWVLRNDGVLEFTGGTGVLRRSRAWLYC
jgi:hypothetical protein